MELIIGFVLLAVIEIVGLIILGIIVTERTAAMQEELVDIRDAVQPSARTAGKLVPVPTPRGIQWQRRPPKGERSYFGEVAPVLHEETEPGRDAT